LQTVTVAAGCHPFLGDTRGGKPLDQPLYQPHGIAVTAMDDLIVTAGHALLQITAPGSPEDPWAPPVIRPARIPGVVPARSVPNPSSSSSSTTPAVPAPTGIGGRPFNDVHLQAGKTGLRKVQPGSGVTSGSGRAQTEQERLLSTVKSAVALRRTAIDKEDDFNSALEEVESSVSSADAAAEQRAKEVAERTREAERIRIVEAARKAQGAGTALPDEETRKRNLAETMAAWNAKKEADKKKDSDDWDE